MPAWYTSFEVENMVTPVELLIPDESPAWEMPDANDVALVCANVFSKDSGMVKKLDNQSTFK
jgi:hypothetical protein